MTSKELVIKVLDNHGCQDVYAIVRDAKRLFKEDITPSSAGAALRSLAKEGEVGSSRDGNGRTIYWLARTNGYHWDGYLKGEDE